MKLLRHTQRGYLQLAIPVFLLAGMGMYLLLIRAVYDFSDENLQQTRIEIENYIHEHNTLPAYFQTSAIFMDSRQLITACPERYLDTLLFNAAEGEQEPYRRLEFPVLLQGKHYQVAINQSRLEHEELALSIGLFLAVLFLLLFGLLWWVNRRVADKVWQPFFTTLGQLRKFNLAENTPLHLHDTPVDEFRELHSALQTLSTRVRADFQAVRQFTENASHELQTPLAVLQNEVNLLLQQEQLTAAQARHLEVIARQTRRVSRLNQSLLLLAKIENDQFAHRKPVALHQLIGQKLEGLADVAQAKNLTIEKTLAPVSIALNADLADILMTNILGNAIKHNVPGGFLQVQLTETGLLVRNACQKPDKPPGDLTNRFVRGNARVAGQGLGLAIVQEICLKSNFQLKVQYADGVWETAIYWPGQG
ncbi:MAG: HAMP domain-containing histidine kinase [Lewinellaceae bacterium]|nr:HAMP domain-containing histidine kinase [Saprospiraceae bacterium]MCB9334127.1 HAMP domain-containing histidine kinase [Lewinellaceae bacterium]